MNKNKIICLWLMCLFLIGTLNLSANRAKVIQGAAPVGMVKIHAGSFLLFYSKKDNKPVKVKSFYIDIYPVTNGQFLEFVKANPKWARSKISSLFADTNYVKHWGGDFNLGKDSEAIRNSPVTNISWFAADAYCKWKGKRLPTTLEWEYAASADRAEKMQGDTTTLTTYILNWYSKPTPKIIPGISSTFKNKFGVWDMHGLVWEWVFDFNTSLTSGDSRSNNEIDRNFSCASGSLASSNKKDYASYMRYAFRGSLKANYAVNNLGFRCVMDAK